MAHAITYTEIGSPAVLEYVEIPDPVAGAEDVIVRIEAAGVNPLDAKLRNGGRPGPAFTSPRRVGFDGAGVIESVGANVHGFAAGDRVAIREGAGTYATLLAVPATKLTLLPDAVTAAEGAALGIPAGTAYQVLKSLAVTKSDTVLIHAGAGAVGQIMVQFAVSWGATVIATASPARHEQLRALGAVPVAYGAGLRERIDAVAPAGISVAIDCAGTEEALQVSLDLVSDRDRIATIVRGADAPALGIRGFMGGSPIPLTQEEQAWRALGLPLAIDLVAAGDLVVEFGPEFPLAEAARAHELIEAHAANGKIILFP